MSTQGYVLGPAEGEHLIRNAGSYIIKVDPSRGSHNMALGTQQVPIRTGIQVHQHQEADEVLFVLEGTGFGILGDARMTVEKGSAIYIPKGVWHGVENPDSELLLLWVVATDQRRRASRSFPEIARSMLKPERTSLRIMASVGATPAAQ
jgi:mannose-6-phosphate isomerase-like protein (cupin superfamily)